MIINNNIRIYYYLLSLLINNNNGTNYNNFNKCGFYAKLEVKISGRIRISKY